MDNRLSALEAGVDAAFDSFEKCQIPRWDNLPEIELYMDQLVAVTEKYLTKVKFPGSQGDEKFITPSMVNNYVKKGYMPPPVKKKYNKVHIAHLLVICIMKQSMPIAVIDFFIKSLLDVMEIDMALDLFLDTYEACFLSSMKEMHESYCDMRDSLEDTVTPKAMMAIRASAMANAGKVMGYIVNDSLIENKESDLD